MAEMLIDINEASRITRLPAEVIKGAVRRGALAAVRPAGFPKARFYFEREDVEAWLEASKNNTTPDTDEDA